MAEPDALFGTLDSDQEQRIFDYWRYATNRLRATFTPGRRAKIRTRLGDSTYEEIIAAIDACADSRWHMDRGVTDLTYILRSRERVEDLIERARIKREQAANTYKRHDYTVYDKRVRHNPHG